MEGGGSVRFRAGRRAPAMREILHILVAACTPQIPKSDTQNLGDKLRVAVASGLGGGGGGDGCSGLGGVSEGYGGGLGDYVRRVWLSLCVVLRLEGPIHRMLR